MADVGKFLGSLAGGAADPASGILGAAKGIIGMFKLDPTKKAEIAEQLTLANLDLEKTAMAGDIAALQGQLEVNKTEAASQNVFVSGWRPFVGWVCGSAFAWAFVLQPFAAFTLGAFGKHLVLPTLDLSNLMPVLLGMLGLGAMRTYEKISAVPNVNQKD
ncbi:MAG TPA: holin family protein [Candidatus Acidoferrum sp.]|nr:holin family protein [Candidatus Acidoferrum sp.]